MANITGPLQVQLKQWWSSITQREQRLVIIAAVCLVVGIVYWGFYQPLNQRISMAKTRVHSEKQLLNWVSDKADHIVALRKQGGQTAALEPLNRVIANSSNDFNIGLIRVQPRGDNKMQVWVQPLPFSHLLDWIAFLKEKQGIDVEYLDIDKGAKPGLVDVKRLQLKRGA
ncbi:type II secretion system protein M [Vibrio palustris]|uniref:Type II secretion system protein M n=1 Tax=Vibrio palustris TaxID=1918946 RepID=A0A1R4B791_9VIBR|nr:type II secretion system protein M [Vibrio palustris]SJL84784.1 Type II secretion system protein M [Vibrio palustris]